MRERRLTESTWSSYCDGDVGSLSDSGEGKEGSEDGEGGEHLEGTVRGVREGGRARGGRACGEW